MAFGFRDSQKGNRQAAFGFASVAGDRSGIRAAWSDVLGPHHLYGPRIPNPVVPIFSRPKLMHLSSTIKERALAAGFDLVGVVSLDPAPQAFWEDLGFARRWVDAGRGGEMHYLANPKRDDPRLVLPSAKSVICVGLIYNAPLPYSTEAPESGRHEAESSRQKAEGRRQRLEGSSKLEIRSQRLANRDLPAVSPSASCFQPTADGLPPAASRSHAWISRYAWGHDYHRVMRARLERLRAEIGSLAPGVETRVYVDTGPIVERALARYSGIGWVGKNTCLIHQEKGSWLFLGIILTSLALRPDFPAPDRCGSCTRCLEACPTGALTEPYVMDASRCIAYLTIELKGSIPLEFRSDVGRNVFGCDICQDVCPWNRGSSDEYGVASGESKDDGHFPALGNRPRSAASTDRPEFQPLFVTLPGAGTLESEAADGRAPEARSFSLFNPPLEALSTLSEEDFKRAFARSPIKRAKYRGWLRNLCVAIGNSGSTHFTPWLESARHHPDPVVREHAEWALSQLRRTGQ